LPKETAEIHFLHPHLNTEKSSTTDCRRCRFTVSSNYLHNSKEFRPQWSFALHLYIYEYLQV